jgi:hypothetical protein
MSSRTRRAAFSTKASSRKTARVRDNEVVGVEFVGPHPFMVGFLSICSIRKNDHLNSKQRAIDMDIRALPEQTTMAPSVALTDGPMERKGSEKGLQF